MRVCVMVSLLYHYEGVCDDISIVPYEGVCDGISIVPL